MASLTVTVSMKDTDAFTSLMKYAQGLTDLVSKEDLPEETKEKIVKLKTEFLSAFKLKVES